MEREDLLGLIQLTFIFKQLSYRALSQVQSTWGECLWLIDAAERLMEAAEQEGFPDEPVHGGQLGYCRARGSPGGEAQCRRGVCDQQSQCVEDAKEESEFQ